MRDTVRIDIEVTEEIKSEAEWIANDDGISVSSIIRQFIRQEYKRRLRDRLLRETALAVGPLKKGK